ncbi:MAG: transglutaminase-like domain-containing protein [Clostridia bacterium]|nr:transglutaminase-like domain-containing protein [Clostridia bacterium]
MLDKFHSPIRILYSYIIVMALNISVVEIFCETYMLPINLTFFISNVAAMVAAIAILNGVKMKRFSLIGFVLLGIGSIYFINNRTDLVLCIRKIFLSIQGMAFFKYQILNNTTKVPINSLSECWSLIMVLPSYFLTLALEKKLNIFIGLTWYIGLFVTTVLLNYSFAYWYWYAIFIAACLLVVLFGLIRKHESRLVDKIMLIMFIPVVLIAFIPTYLYPMESYDFHTANDQFNAVIMAFDKATSSNLADVIKSRVFDRDTTGLDSDINAVRPVNNVVSFIVAQNGAISTTSDNLNNQGAFVPINATIMEIKLNLYDEEYIDEFGGRNFYLLSTSMGFFDGNSWMRGNAPDTTDSEFVSQSINIPASLSISTRSVWDSILVPNYAGRFSDTYGFDYSSIGEITSLNNVDRYFMGEYFDNANGYNKYDWILRAPSECDPVSEINEEYRNYIDGVCTHVPEDIEFYILDNVDLPEWYIDAYKGYSSYSTLELTKLVMDYVHSTHTYDQDTSYPGNDEAHDFVSWFLSESETGYCVHFASATAVLLRMLNIPSRYCLGYEVNHVQPNKTITVYDTDAHAWCEVWTDEYGWVQIDPTSNTFVNGPRFENEIKIDVERPRSTPTPTPRPNGVAVEEAEGGQMVIINEFGEKKVYYVKNEDLPIVIDLSPHEGTISRKTERTLLVILFVLIAMLTYRIVYSALWKHRFRSSNKNLAVRAYGRYYYLFVRFYRAERDEVIDRVVDKAMYSREGVSEEEFIMISSRVIKKVNRLISGGGLLKKFISATLLKV